ncbi:MAG: catalase family protein [Xanthobacteraceae bacterium]
MSESFAIDAELGEALQANEEQIAEQIGAALSKQVECESEEGKRRALRDAHPKSHGCVEAEFRVDDNVPPHLAQGVFVPGKSYPAWIRFSNGNPDPTKHDAKSDIRGMAIKLLDVPGDKILAEEREARTQDFLLMSSPAFFMDDAARYLRFSRAIASSNPLMQFMALPALGLSGYRIVQRAKVKIASPLETRYWSAVPYRLGEGPRKQAVKYSARPQPVPVSTAVPSDPVANFLRETMVKQLAAGEARFDFLVQPRKSPAMSVENTMVEWKDDETEAPFIKVATITIPRQQFDTPERNDFGEDLSFTPWHALPAHRPLGAVNRIRRVVYQAISRKRHDLNTVPRREPGA